MWRLRSLLREKLSLDWLHTGRASTPRTFLLLRWCPFALIDLRTTVAVQVSVQWKREIISY